MKKKPTYTLSNQQQPLKTHGDINGPVTSYVMNPTDFDEWRSKLPPKPDHVKDKLAYRVMNGGDAS